MFKKSVKLTMSVVPTQTNQTLPQATTPSDSDGGSNVGESITFDGKTFTVTFSQISGIMLESV